MARLTIFGIAVCETLVFFLNYKKRTDNCIFDIMQGLLLSFVSSTYALYASISNVVQVGANDFEEEVLHHSGVVIVEFFAPWYKDK